jgi:hypothetical protein
MYRWVDRNGKVQYSDQPSPQDAKQKGVVTNPNPLSQLYRGCYIAGFETSAFNPVGTKDSWWVDWEVDTTILRKARAQEPGSPSRPSSVFMVVRGRISEEGAYGHMGGYRRKIIVSEIISARKPLPEDQCGLSAESDDGASLYQQGLALERGGQGKEAIRIYRRAARAGSGKAAKRLGEIFDKGIPGVPRDYADSRLWYEKARELGESIDLSGKR